jgi:hypothetical protein
MTLKLKRPMAEWRRLPTWADRNGRRMAYWADRMQDGSRFYWVRNGKV